MKNLVLSLSLLFVFLNLSATTPPPPKKFSEKTAAKIKAELSTLNSPKAREKRKRGQMLPTAAQFSGAFQWAHKQGITGKGQIVIVMEGKAPPLILLTENLKEPSVPERRKEFQFEHGKKEEENLSSIYEEDNPNDHHINTTNTLHQIAPDSTIIRTGEDDKDLPLLFHFLNELKPHNVVSKVVSSSTNLDKADWKTKFGKPLRENFSSWRECIEYNQFVHTNHYKNLVTTGDPKLFFKSAGNNGINLSTPIHTPEEEITNEELQTFLEDPEFEKHLIIVGSVDQHFMHIHNFPGENPLIQNNFLCALGREVRVLDRKGYLINSGTSFATPIAAGAALLLMQKFPSLDIFQIKEVLLESAARSFVIQGTTSRDKVKIIFVYDPNDGAPNLEKLKDDYGPHGWVENYDISAQPFDPKKYGSKGILDLHAAFIYAKLKVDHPSWSKKELRNITKDIMAGEEDDAATKIQTAFRKHLAHKKTEKANKH